MSKNRIIQTFWTKPMDCSHLYLTLRMMFISAKSIKRQGYEIVLYTDILGSRLVENFPYDEVVVIDMPEKVNPQMFAAMKYFALKDEPLGTIHLDYDIVLDKPCISPKDGWDVITQMKHFGNIPYKKERTFMEANGTPQKMKEIQLSSHPYCVGVIGFNNEDLKKIFLDNYFDAINLYSGKNISGTIDFLLEQTFISSLVDKYGYNADFVTKEDKSNYVYPTESDSVRYFTDTNIGFTHYHSKSKWTTPVLSKISDLLSKEEKSIVDKNYMSAISGK